MANKFRSCMRINYAGPLTPVIEDAIRQIGVVISELI